MSVVLSARSHVYLSLVAPPLMCLSLMVVSLRLDVVKEVQFLRRLIFLLPASQIDLVPHHADGVLSLLFGRIMRGLLKNSSRMHI